MKTSTVVQPPFFGGLWEIFLNKNSPPSARAQIEMEHAMHASENWAARRPISCLLAILKPTVAMEFSSMYRMLWVCWECTQITQSNLLLYVNSASRQHPQQAMGAVPSQQAEPRSVGGFSMFIKDHQPSLLVLGHIIGMQLLHKVSLKQYNQLEYLRRNIGN